MCAVLLTAHGGLEKLEYRDDVATPIPEENEVLIKVSAAGMNNTDINTRIGWYSKSVTGETSDGGLGGFELAESKDSSWGGATIDFPRIQGADCCGYVVACGSGIPSSRIGERVIVRSIIPDPGKGEFYCFTVGSEIDGGFAQYLKIASKDALKIDCDWSDEEIASIPCAYSTAENLLERSSLAAERVLITGASGGVGSAAIQLARRRGAEVLAVASAAKKDEVLAIGAETVFDREADLVAALGKDSVDLVVDLVGGPGFPQLLDILRVGGRYATAGAIAGPIVDLDLRTLYLKDQTFFGCTHQENRIFENLVSYIEKNEIRPLVAKSFPLGEIRAAQEEFLSKKHTGKMVLLPPA